MSSLQNSDNSNLGIGTEILISVKFTEVDGDVIARDQCKKLRHCIMNIDTAKKVDELLKLTIAH